jgi:hypothetical protein
MGEREAKALSPDGMVKRGSALRIDPKHRSPGRQPMQYDAGIDVSLEQSRVCVVDAAGKNVKEAKVVTEPHIPVTFCKGLGFGVTRIGLEARPVSRWLYTSLIQRSEKRIGTESCASAACSGETPRLGALNHRENLMVERG